MSEPVSRSDRLEMYCRRRQTRRIGAGCEGSESTTCVVRARGRWREIYMKPDLLCSEECCAYPITFDGTTVNTRSFLDVNVRSFANGNIENVHLLVIPLHGRNRGEAMAKIVGDLFSVLHGAAWKDKLVGACTDGARNMIGKVSEVVTRFAVGTLEFGVQHTNWTL
jgi:hypothetical protein